MDATMLKIKVLYNDMGRAEKKIADWITQHPGELIELSITELAEQCGCGEATIVRFARRLGCSGYQELKISLAREEGTREVSLGIHPADSCYAVFEKVANDIFCSLERTKRVLSGDMLQQAADAIISAGRIVIFGLGNSASVAMDAQHKLMRAGFNAAAYSDNHMQAIAASQTGPGDVAVGISHSGSSRDIVDALKIARSKGATTVCITNKGKSPVTKQSDIVLYTASDETRYSILALNSRISQLAVIDSLYCYLVCQKDENAISAIESTEQALQSKKY
jgi:RpiR family carbohydrate utilization transcriptional regulator